MVVRYLCALSPLPRARYGDYRVREMTENDHWPSRRPSPYRSPMVHPHVLISSWDGQALNPPLKSGVLIINRKRVESHFLRSFLAFLRLERKQIILPVQILPLMRTARIFKSYSGKKNKLVSKVMVKCNFGHRKSHPTGHYFSRGGPCGDLRGPK